MTGVITKQENVMSYAILYGIEARIRSHSKNGRMNRGYRAEAWDTTNNGIDHVTSWPNATAHDEGSDMVKPDGTLAEVGSSKKTVCDANRVNARNRDEVHAEIDRALDAYYTTCKATVHRYVTNDLTATYEMDHDAFRAFMHAFGTIDNSRGKLRIKEESSKTIPWLEARAA